MSTTGESSESSRTLPRAELNPLLNPILASHMGRWAEVYFTSPPEKREEAVLELLRELEAADPGNSSSASTPEQEPIDSAKLFPPPHGIGGSGAPSEQVSVRCQRCGHDNPSTHQFCGMCGASLQMVKIDQFATDSPYGQHEGEMESRESNPPSPAIEQELPYSYRNEPEQPRQESRSDPYDLSILKGLRQREIDDYEYEDPPSHRYRYYVGAMLVILLTVLGYTAWRSAQNSQNSHQASVPPPPAPVESAPANQPVATQPVAPQPTTAAPEVPAKTAEPPTSAPSPNVSDTGKTQKAENTSHTAATPGQNSRSSAAPVGATEPQFTSSSGAEDLVMAQRYLAGGNGQARDPAEAAKWLWKAMGKHNGPATLQLADLYLKGDGVPKNCEQARVLLDTAARRGMTGAGERLRNIQAFGCQ